MSENRCNIIKDILPLYVDEVVSGDTKNFVEEHLQECKECSGELDILKKQAYFPPELQGNVFKRIKKKMFRKSVLIVVISIICAIPIAIVTYNYVYEHQTIIPYSESGVTVTEDKTKGEVWLIVKGEYFTYDPRNYFTRPVEKDGVRKKVAYVYSSDYTGIKYSKKVTHAGYSETLIGVVNEDNDAADIIVDVIDAVYYLEGNYTSTEKYLEMSDKEFAKQAEDAVLLWER